MQKEVHKLQRKLFVSRAGFICDYCQSDFKKNNLALIIKAISGKMKTYICNFSFVLVVIIFLTFCDLYIYIYILFLFLFYFAKCKTKEIIFIILYIFLVFVLFLQHTKIK